MESISTPVCNFFFIFFLSLFLFHLSAWIHSVQRTVISFWKLSQTGLFCGSADTWYNSYFDLVFGPLSVFQFLVSIKRRSSKHFSFSFMKSFPFHTCSDFVCERRQSPFICLFTLPNALRLLLNCVLSHLFPYSFVALMIFYIRFSIHKQLLP